MPYSFIEIEKETRWVIRAVFLFLVFLYFLFAEALWLVTKLYFLFKEIVLGNEALFSWNEAAIVSAVALAAALIHWRASTANMVDRIAQVVGATAPDPKDFYHTVFRNVVDEVSVATGGMKIDARVIPSSGLNACAISDFKGNKVIGVTEGLLARLSRSQLEAVIGHEAAHIVSGDSLTTTMACSLFGIYAALLAGASRALERPTVWRGRRSEGAWIYLVIIYLVLVVVQGVGLLVNMFLSRQKETRADAVAVRLTRDPLALAEALYIISRGWRGIGEIPDSLSPIFFASPDYKNLDESEGLLANLFSTHPPTNRRLEMLLSMAHADLAALAPVIRPKARVAVEDGIVTVSGEPGKEWFIYRENMWQGPFGLDELAGLGLAPNSWVAKRGEKTVSQASEVDVLNEALKAKLAGKPIASGEMCPECTQPLGEVLYEGTPVLTCYYCDGIFARSTSVLRIMVRKDYSFPSSIEKSAEFALKTNSKGIYTRRFNVVYALTCPHCGGKMARGFYSLGYPIEVDRCGRCDAIWFQKFELETLQYLFEKFESRDETKT